MVNKIDLNCQMLVNVSVRSDIVFSIIYNSSNATIEIKLKVETVIELMDAIGLSIGSIHEEGCCDASIWRVCDILIEMDQF